MKKLTREQIRFLTIRTIGNFLVLGSLFGMFLTFGPAVKNEIIYRYERWKGIKYVVATTEVPTITPSPEPSQRGFFGEILNKTPEVRALTPVDADFGIIIPKIAANAKVIPEVDAGDYNAYMEALRKGVAHALGTNFPGEGGNIYLFAHSTDNFWNVGRYNAVFYLLKEIEAGDEVDLFFKGVRYIYIVDKKEIVDPSAVSFLTEATQSEQLTLQTCWPPGTTLKRLVVIAKPIAQTNQANSPQ